MTLAEVNALCKKLIEAGIEESEAKKEIQILTEELKDTDKIEAAVNERITSRKPIQYILGKAWFMDFEVKVNEAVLIPRPETEVLVELTLNRLRTMDNIQCPASILDIGTGSGIIPIALCKANSNIKCTAIDISSDAINIAKENTSLNKVDGQINFQVCDIFSNDYTKLIKENSFDLIISNPPYIGQQTSDNRALQPELLHEPKLALHGSKENPSGLIYYERILETSSDLPLAFEIDPEISKVMAALMEKYKINTYQIIKDYSNNDRYLIC